MLKDIIIKVNAINKKRDSQRIIVHNNNQLDKFSIIVDVESSVWLDFYIRIRDWNTKPNFRYSIFEENRSN